VNMYKEGKDILMAGIEKHPMAERQFDLTFIYTGDQLPDYEGKEITYSAAQNTMTNDWMYWWSYSNAMYVGTKGSIRKVVKAIRKREEVTLDTFDKF